MNKRKTLIDLVDIKKSYFIADQEFPVLHGISLSIKQQDFVAIMGSSGSGKSTLMNIIGLLDHPGSGQYFLYDHDVSSLTDDQAAAMRNKNIGFVFQQFYLLSKLTVAQNVGLPLTYRHEKTSDIRKKVLNNLDRVGMADYIDRHPNELSGGQQQRVAIARALIGEPTIILADEPTGSLDSKTGHDIMNLFHELNDHDQRTIVMITHDPELGKQCKRHVLLRDGLVVEQGGDSH